MEEQDCNEILYESDGIHTLNRQAIIRRNQQKQENLYRLTSTGQIWKIPYKVYYMSCNLDHVLHNKRNSTDEDKEDDAYAFAIRYRKIWKDLSSLSVNRIFLLRANIKKHGHILRMV